MRKYIVLLLIPAIFSACDKVKVVNDVDHPVPVKITEDTTSSPGQQQHSYPLPRFVFTKGEIHVNGPAVLKTLIFAPGTRVCEIHGNEIDGTQPLDPSVTGHNLDYTIGAEQQLVIKEDPGQHLAQVGWMAY